MPELDLAIRIATQAHANVLWLLRASAPSAVREFDTTPGELLRRRQSEAAA